jgi:hypothetical protein
MTRFPKQAIIFKVALRWNRLMFVSPDRPISQKGSFLGRSWVGWTFLSILPHENARISWKSDCWVINCGRRWGLAASWRVRDLMCTTARNYISTSTNVYCNIRPQIDPRSSCFLLTGCIGLPELDYLKCGIHLDLSVINVYFFVIS